MFVGVSVWLGWSGIRVAGFYVLNMFQTLIYPSSGACDYSVELPLWSYCSWFDVCWSFGLVGLEWYPYCRLKCMKLYVMCTVLLYRTHTYKQHTEAEAQPATRIPLQPNHTETPTHIEPRTIRPMW